jgi:L-malate glycosyltransferase
MKILFLVSTLGLGGAEKQLIAWAQILQARFRAEVFVASFAATVNARRGALEELGVPVLIVGRDISNAQRIGRVMSFVRKNRVDVVHAFSFRLSPIAVLTATASGAAVAASFQGDGEADIRLLSAPQRLLTLRTVKRYTSNSRDAIARVRSRLRADAVLEYVPNLVTPPDPECIERRRVAPDHDPVALAVARLDHNKRLDVFLDALVLARKSEPRLTGVIVGDGPDRDQLTERALSLGLLPEGVTFPGAMLDPSDNYAGADIFVHLAESEGMPNVVLEAMATGLPVVTTAAGDLRNLMRPNENGLLVPLDDARSVAESLIHLVRDPSLRAKLGHQGREDTLNSFNVQTVGDALDRFYSTVIPLNSAVAP